MIRRLLHILGLAFVTSVASATSPNPYSEGLSLRVVGDSRLGEVAVLRASPSGRVRIPAGAYTTGSTLVEMGYAKELCRREPLGPVEVPIESAIGTIRRESVHCDLTRKFEGEGLLLPEGVSRGGFVVPASYSPNRRSVTMSSFLIDRTEVRVDEYLGCVRAGACAQPGFSLTDQRFARPDLPVVLVTWEDAKTYCAFAKGRLPTEAEWEVAARGTEGRWFPWGNVYNPHLSNHGSLSSLDPTDATDGFAGLAPVGSMLDGRTPLGLLDMVGNAAEWTADSVEPIAGVMAVPPYCPREGERAETYGHCCLAPQVWSRDHNRCEGCFNKQSWSATRKVCEGIPECPKGASLVGEACIPLPLPTTRVNPVSTSGTLRIVRGGSYMEGAHMQRAASRDARYPLVRYPDVGFRCASDP